MMRYNIVDIINSAFDLDDLSDHPKLRNSIFSLINPSYQKIKVTRDLLSQSSLPWKVTHHIEIRLELISDNILNN